MAQLYKLPLSPSPLFPLVFLLPPPNATLLSSFSLSSWVDTGDITMTDQEWVDVALTDDLLVVELLLRLNRPTARHHLPPALRLDWTVRQPRSKPVPRHIGDALNKSEATRASPNTPLTWSAATSVSGDGVDDSTQVVKASDGARSKIAGKSEVVATMKRARKKKTLAELKEEESLLLKERKNLKDALATLRLSVEKNRIINGCLKKMKLDFQAQQVMEMAVVTSVAPKEVNSSQPQQQIARSICSTVPIGVAAFGCKLQEIGALGTVRLLPDLNLPFQDDSGPEVLYRMS